MKLTEAQSREIVDQHGVYVTEACEKSVIGGTSRSDGCFDRTSAVLVPRYRPNSILRAIGFSCAKSQNRFHESEVMSLDFEIWNNEPSRTAHVAPYETHQRADRRRELWKKAVLFAIYVVAVLASIWAIRRS